MKHRRRVQLSGGRRTLVVLVAMATAAVFALVPLVYQSTSQNATADRNSAVSRPPDQPTDSGPAAGTRPSAGSSSAGLGKAPLATATPRPTTSPTAGSPAPKGQVGSRDCALPAYPTATCTGVPAGWRPRVTHTGSLTISRAGTVIEDYLVTGSIMVQAPDVTIRRTRLYGTIDNFVGPEVYGGLLIEDTEVVNPPGEEFSTNHLYAFGVGGYTCRRCKVVNRLEGFRVGGASAGGAGPVVIEDSFIQLAVPPGLCQSEDPHGDGIQAYDGPFVTIRHNTIDQRRDHCPTAPIFVPDQGNAGATVENNVVAGGSYSLRLTGGYFPSVRGNKIVDGTPNYGPFEVTCSKIGAWADNSMVTVDWAAGRVTNELRTLKNCA
jgi:hypothetical protein